MLLESSGAVAGTLIEDKQMNKTPLIISWACVPIVLIALIVEAAPNPKCGLNPHSKGVATKKDDLMRQIAVCFDSGRHVTLYRDNYPDIEVYCYETDKERRKRLVLERVAAKQP